jgi:acyl-CoA thioester hydrolase
VGIFREDDHEASAQGHFVHVYVDRVTRKPTPIPDKARALLESIRVMAEGTA